MGTWELRQCRPSPLRWPCELPLPLSMWSLSPPPGQERWYWQQCICCLWNKLIGQRKRGPTWRKKAMIRVHVRCFWPPLHWHRKWSDSYKYIYMHRRVWNLFVKWYIFSWIYIFFLFVRGQLGLQYILVVGWGESIKFHGKLGFSHHLQ